MWIRCEGREKNKGEKNKEQGKRNKEQKNKEQGRKEQGTRDFENMGTREHSALRISHSEFPNSNFQSLISKFPISHTRILRTFRVLKQQIVFEKRDHEPTSHYTIPRFDNAFHRVL